MCIPSKKCRVPKKGSVQPTKNLLKKKKETYVYNL
jgi:hypothetical protein